jgi:hypothetical protein
MLVFLCAVTAVARHMTMNAATIKTATRFKAMNTATLFKGFISTSLLDSFFGRVVCPLNSKIPCAYRKSVYEVGTRQKTSPFR